MSEFHFNKVDQKIAVFCTDANWVIHGSFYPREQFRRIKSIEDVRGVLFTGVIVFNSALLSYDQKRALKDLKERQQDLFKK